MLYGSHTKPVPTWTNGYQASVWMGTLVYLAYLFVTENLKPGSSRIRERTIRFAEVTFDNTPHTLAEDARSVA